VSSSNHRPPGEQRMKVFKLIYKNLLRHKLRTLLTILGFTIAVMSFSLLNTIITAWYASVDASAQNRLIIRHAVSFTLPLPYSYKARIERIPGVSKISYSNWFGGVYIEEKNFFVKMAVDASTFFDLYPEFILSSNDDLDIFKRERNACVIGQKLASKYHLKIGDILNIRGDIYPGEWQFVIRAIYHGREKSTDETQMFFHWEYLDEWIKREWSGTEGMIGWFVVEVKNQDMIPAVSEAIDKQFKNSANETKTETEKAFQLSFVSMSGAIITAIRVISYIIIGIILLVLANTMIMTTRERVREYAVFKTLGFSSGHILGLISGESLAIAAIGGILGLWLTFPISAGIAEQLSTFFPVFTVEQSTMIMAGSLSLIVGIISAVFPTIRALNTSIVDGLRQIG
jgi:putative ABC transport system permease protein